MGLGPPGGCHREARPDAPLGPRVVVPPFSIRALGRFEEWLWDHGGYVEEPEATAERERRNALYQAQHAVIRAALDRPGPWLAPTTVRTQNVQVVDVDRYRSRPLAVATAMALIGRFLLPPP